MREILFRAKSKYDLEWIEGYYAKVEDYLSRDDIHVIFPTDTTLYPGNEFAGYEEVIPETVCQFMNEEDMDGNRIFEFDIIECYDNRGIKRECPPLVVQDDRGSFCSETGLGRWRPNGYNCKVIGNAYDNPELLKGHGMSHFVRDIGELPDDYIERHHELTDKYGIHGAHAGCYLVNYESDYVCHKFNGGCNCINVCRQIHEAERLEEELAKSVIHAQWVPMKVYPDEFTCSYCGELWPDEKVDICPECGAVMDADTGNEKGE